MAVVSSNKKRDFKIILYIALGSVSDVTQGALKKPPQGLGSLECVINILNIGVAKYGGRGQLAPLH